MSDDRFDVVVHHSGEVEAHEEAAEVEIEDASGLNSDVEVEGEIEMEGDIGHNRNNCPDKHVDEQTATPTETTPDAQTTENAPTVETAENAPIAETQTTQPAKNEVESQAAPLPTPEEPSQQFRMKL